LPYLTITRLLFTIITSGLLFYFLPLLFFLAYSFFAY